MSKKPLGWGDDWSLGLRIWIERSGRPILGTGRLDLLEAIERSGSISAAARELGMSYRRAWLLVQSTNQAAGTPLVMAATGGNQGGGAQLTPQGQEAVRIFRELHAQVHRTTGGILSRLVQTGEPEPLHVLAAVSLEEALGQLLADHSLRQPGVRVRTIFGASNELADHLLAGAPCDLYLTADARQLDRLRAAGRIDARPPTILAENGLAAIGLKDSPAPIRRPSDLGRSQVASLALAEPACPLGHYSKAFLESRRLYDKLLPRLLHVDNSRAVVTAVRSGQAEVGLVYTSDAVHADGCRVLFKVRQSPLPIRYFAAIVSRGKQGEQATRLLEFLASDTAAGHFRRWGFLPPS